MTKSRIIVAIVSALLLTGTIGLLSIVSAQSITPPFLDGSASGVCGPCTSVTVSLHTAHGGDVIVVYQGDGGTCVTPNLPHDSTGLQYSLRMDAKYCNNMEGLEFYTVSPSPLSSDTITCSTSGQTWISCIAFGVSGANAASPFDLAQPVVTSTGIGYQSGNSCPKSSTGSVYPCIVSMTTNTADDFVFDMGTDNGDGLPLQTAGSGFNLIAATNPNIQDGYVQYKTASSSLSNDREPFGVAIGMGFIVIGDAIQGLVSTTSSTTSTVSTSSASSSTTTQTLVTSTCTVTFTMTGGTVQSWSGRC